MKNFEILVELSGPTKYPGDKGYDWSIHRNNFLLTKTPDLSGWPGAEEIIWESGTLSVAGFKNAIRVANELFEFADKSKFSKADLKGKKFFSVVVYNQKNEPVKKHRKLI